MAMLLVQECGSGVGSGSDVVSGSEVGSGSDVVFGSDVGFGVVFTEVFQLFTVILLYEYISQTKVLQIQHSWSLFHIKPL